MNGWREFDTRRSLDAAKHPEKKGEAEAAKPAANKIQPKPGWTMRKMRPKSIQTANRLRPKLIWATSDIRPKMTRTTIGTGPKLRESKNKARPKPGWTISGGQLKTMRTTDRMDPNLGGNPNRGHPKMKWTFHRLQPQLMQAPIRPRPRPKRTGATDAKRAKAKWTTPAMNGMRGMAGRLAAAGSAAARKVAEAASRRPGAVLAAAWAMLLTAAALLIPLLVVNPSGVPALPLDGAEAGAPTGSGAEGADGERRAPALEIAVPVYIAAEEQTRLVPIEEYVRGVVAAEMPLEFELEALKAQALAARTYIVQRYVTGQFDGVPEGVDAWVTDTVQHQAFLTEEKLAEKLGGGAQAEEKLAKLNRAVAETSGQVITYEGEPIVASFFSTSNGYTENSEDYWQAALPYLRSVASPWEEGLSPQFRTTVEIPIAEARRKLGLGGKVTISASAANGGGGDGADAAAPLTMKVLERTEGRRIKTISINGRTFTGREVREKLGLPSTEFSWRFADGSIAFTAVGNGHGVGMSQWGAQGMALEGHKAEEIVSYYYTGVKVEVFDPRRLKR